MLKRDVPLDTSSQDSTFKREDLKVILNAAFIISSIITLILSVSAYSYLNSYHANMGDFMNNWSLKPLVDIVASQNGCPSGYENLNDWEWPGTVAGCDCIFSFKYFNRLYTGYCDSN